MATYWIVVPRGNPELLELMSVAFQGRAGFSVIVDRRSEVRPADGNRRVSDDGLERDEFIVAEQAERPAEEREHRHTGHRIPVRRRRPRRSAYGIESAVRPAPLARPATHDRLFTL
jgi:hypothetical protein